MAPGLLVVAVDHSSMERMVHGRINRTSGFTIIELLMVLAIIAILAAVALPKLDFNAYRMNSAVRSLASAMGRAQRMAVTNQSNVNVIFVTSQNAIRIHEDVNNDNIIDPTERVRQYPLGDGVEFSLGGAPTRVYAPGPISFTRQINSMPEVIFRRDGSSSENGAVYISTLNAAARGKSKDTRSVETIQATGRVSWYAYTGAAWVRKY